MKFLKAIAFILLSTLSSQAALHSPDAPMPAFVPKCEKLSSEVFGHENLVMRLRIEENKSFDAVLVFLVEMAPGHAEYVTVTVKRNCVVGIL